MFGHCLGLTAALSVVTLPFQAPKFEVDVRVPKSFSQQSWVGDLGLF
jgi:hypothetical protein